MESVEQVLQLTRLGRFGDALRALDNSKPISARAEREVLRAQLLEQVGQYEPARILAATLLKSKNLAPSRRSECEAVLGRVLFDEGNTERGLAHLQRAALIAQQAADLHALFGAKLYLLIILSDRSGPAAGSSILADVRQIATRLGDPEITARLHLFVAQAEAKRGLLENARRHTSLASRILQTSPNAFLEAFTGNLDLAVAVLRSEFDVAKECGFRALALAEQSGVAKIRSAILGNMGNLFYELGDFERATSYFETALSACPANGANTTAVLDSLARIQLIQGRSDLCLATLDRIESGIHIEQDRLSYEHRRAAFARVDLLKSEGRIDEALARIDSVLELAERTGDDLLRKEVQLAKAELLQTSGRTSSSMALVAEATLGLIGASPELYAFGEQILACALTTIDERSSEAHHARAFRMYRGIGSVPRQTQLAVSWGQARSRQASDADRTLTEPLEKAEARSARLTLHGLAAAFTHATRPELIAAEFVNILSAADCVSTARATVRSAKETEEIISEAASGTYDRNIPEQRFSIGFSGSREIQLHIRQKSGVDSVASINAVTLLLNSLHEIQRARAEREERATLWPIEELPNDERAMISGRMRELMEYARRIARTKVNVLITGESGTGKEILARAIHDFSDRAGRPFVPFNCTAIPRDLLESQLFGHRRGAFTGADRDQLGLIRAAREGTLFLDEVGELGLDLQPKLLRFLESGEISPLGEPGSLTIDVRIVAATNANLEDAVRAGRFREDLFYRLNVVRLTIPPLRERRDEIPGFVNHFVTRAAEEFKKGQLRVAEETMERLLLYRWPGNVRQLQNEMRRMVALTEPDSTLLPHAISEDILGALPIFRHAPANGREIAVDLQDKLMPTIARIECEMIKAALRKHDGRVDAVAKALGISRKGLYLKRQRLGL
jgi:transcriptional regulator with PAS, ATPase and Fis domain/tetratricopeptide (TPR) repeat protein